MDMGYMDVVGLGFWGGTHTGCGEAESEFLSVVGGCCFVGGVHDDYKYEDGVL